VLFGIASVIGLRWLFPPLIRAMKKFARDFARWLNVAFWLIFVGYLFVQVDVVFLNHFFTRWISF
jgi:hypothetical protein